MLRLIGLRVVALLLALSLGLVAQSRITVEGTGFLLDGSPFDYTGVSFFNAVYNKEFNRSVDVRREWIRKFKRYGINVLRVWAQWDNARGFVDACKECTLYEADGSLRAQHLATLQSILTTAAEEGVVVEFCMFSQESWREGIRLSDEAMVAAAGNLAQALKPHPNVTIQIWNEFSHETIPMVLAIRKVDPQRLVTNNPGFAGVLSASNKESGLLDYLTPHTTRQQGGRPWRVAPAEISYLITRFGKPVVDDEPARNGTINFGGPGERTYPEDHIIQIANVWAVGGYITYHHDMFQTGAGAPEVPPSGIPDPEFNPYHRRVFEFLANRERYRQLKTADSDKK